MNYYAKTDIGKVRKKNQDQATVMANNQDQILAVVCDGLGGHKAGEIASRVAVDHIVGCFKVNPPFQSEDEVKKWLHDTIYQTDQIIKKMATGINEQEGMATTAVIAIWIDGIIHCSHVGDSRLYIVNETSMEQITQDHTLVNELVKQGAITQEEAKHHIQKSVLLQAIGAKGDLNPSYSHHKLNKGMTLLCSDGLYNALDLDDISLILKKKLALKERVELLIEKANENGGPDNIAVAIIEA